MSVVTMDQLDAQRLEWVVENAYPAERECLCGCGTMTRRRFAPGHDASLRRSLEQLAENGDKKAAKLADQALINMGWKPSTVRRVRRNSRQRAAA